MVCKVEGLSARTFKDAVFMAVGTRREQLQRRQIIINKPEEALNHASKMKSKVMANWSKGLEKYKALLSPKCPE